MTLSSNRSFLVMRVGVSSLQRTPPVLAPEVLSIWLKQLFSLGVTLRGEEKGIRISWSKPHDPIQEAKQLDTIRVNFESLCSLLKIPLPPLVEDNGDPTEDTSCYHGWRATKHLASEEGTEKDYNQSNLFEEPLNLEGLPILFGDTETTGFDPKEDRIIQLGICRVNPANGIARFYDSYFNPEGQKNKGWSVNRISDWTLRNAPYFRKELPTFYPMFHGAIFIAHNASFDERFLKKEFARYNVSWTVAHVIDTQRIAKFLWPKAPKHKLEVLAPWLGIKQGKVHDAKGDTETLISLWEAIQKERPSYTLSQWAKVAT